MNTTRRGVIGGATGIVAAVAIAASSGCGLYFSAEDPPETSADAGPGPVDPPTAATYCSPRPVTRATDVAPDLYAWIVAAEQGPCSLERRTSTSVPAGSSSVGFPTPVEDFLAPGTQACDATGCWTALPAFARAWTQPLSTPAPSVSSWSRSVQWVGTVQAARNQETGELRATLVAMQFSSTAMQRFERRFDQAGHLLEDRQYFAGGLWFTTTNTWDGDHLISSQFADTINGTGTTVYAWSYSGDQLVGTTTLHAETGRAGAAELAYDEHGRLTSVVRTVDGAVWSRQQWTYGADGALTSSSTELVPAAYDAATEVIGGDDLGPLIVADSQLAWDVASTQAAPDGCAALPHGLTYGYPESDGVYALGWPVGDRPTSIDGDYGFGGTFDRALDRWYGHDRVETLTWWLPWAAPELRAELSYDERGHMIREEVSASDGSAASVRTRVLDGERVTSDRRVLRVGADELTSELEFELDVAGRVIGRDHMLNGTLVARHSWLWAGDEITRHRIARNATKLAGRLWDIPVDVDALALSAKDLAAPIVHERSFSADGHTVALERDGVLLETRRSDAAGRLIERSGPFAGEDTFAYEPDGELRAYDSDWDADGVPDLGLAYERDADGRLQARRWQQSQQLTGIDSFAYVCE